MKYCKSFWGGFRLGFARGSLYGLPLVTVFLLGLYLGSVSHPYEVCKIMYDTPEDISECVWIKEND